MISVGGFFLGLLLLVIGFFTVWKSNILRRDLGDIGDLIGFSWMDWPVIGIVTMVIGAMTMLGIIEGVLGLIGGLFFRPIG